MNDLEQLKDRWKYLYAEYLPSLAQARDPSQPKWPVNLDHCFARIVLDNAIGKDRPWTEVIKSPAVKNMTEQQFDAAIVLAEKIVSGDADLVALDEQSLQLRGKKPKLTGTMKRNAGVEDDKATASRQAVKRKAEKDDAGPTKARKKKGDETISSYFLPSPISPLPKKDLKTTDNEDANETLPDKTTENPGSEAMSAQLQRIKDSHLTSFRKQTLSLLCHIPRGRYSTYQAMSDHISATSHKTCARAVGNAMRNNPFAPEVPCHRILAADGSLGGFCGHWGEEGKFASKKHELLNEEGVRFDTKGKVKGPVFRGWK